MNGSESDQAAEVLARMQAISPGGQTFSGGIATWNGKETSGELVARAGHALYDAKAAGRDCVLIGKKTPVPPGFPPRPSRTDHPPRTPGSGEPGRHHLGLLRIESPSPSPGLRCAKARQHTLSRSYLSRSFKARLPGPRTAGLGTGVRGPAEHLAALQVRALT